MSIAVKRWLASVVSGLLASAAITVVAASAPAAADEFSAMNRCTQGQVPNHDSPHVTVRGNGGGNDPAGVNPPNILEPGDAFIVVPDMTTRISVDHWGESYDPNGRQTVAPPTGWPFPGLREFSAVLRFNNNPGGWVGAPAQATDFNRCNTWRSSFPVRLLFAANDPGPGDNGGAWTFHVMIYKASAPATRAMDRCSQRMSPDPGSQTVTVSGVSGGSIPGGPNPGNVLSRGDVLRIIPHYNSYVYVDNWGSWFGPDGNLVSAPSTGWPFSNLFEFAPVLRFNNNPGGWVGTPAQATALGGCMVWQSGFPVRLLFYVNDPNVSDNWGGWDFDVLIYKA